MLLPAVLTPHPNYVDALAPVGCCRLVPRGRDRLGPSQHFECNCVGGFDAVGQHHLKDTTEGAGSRSLQGRDRGWE